MTVTYIGAEASRTAGATGCTATILAYSHNQVVPVTVPFTLTCGATTNIGYTWVRGQFTLNVTGTYTGEYDGEPISNSGQYVPGSATVTDSLGNLIATITTAGLTNGPPCGTFAWSAIWLSPGTYTYAGTMSADTQPDQSTTVTYPGASIGGSVTIPNVSVAPGEPCKVTQINIAT